MSAIQLSDGTLVMTGVSPGLGIESHADPASPYRLEARDASGKILASVPVAYTPLHSHLDPRLVMITGAVHRPSGTAQLVLRRGTETATRRQRSRFPPTISLLSPRRGTVRGARVTVRWRASDRDRDPLTAEVDYSPNGGRSWNPVSIGPSRGRVVISTRLLKASRRARLRVRVDDGFDDATAVSGPLVVPGAPPQVLIQAPVRSQRIRASAPLYLQGLATGDQGLSLRPRALRWFDGPRALGSGRSVSVTGLAAGRHTIRLEAREGARIGTASVRIVIRAVQPAFLVLAFPARISSRARTVRLRVASTVGATLTVSRQRFAVGPRALKIALRIRPGTAPLRLALALRAGRFFTRQPVTIGRG
jgi:hypothetical protein